jgi:hypothetical protein
LLRPRPPAAGYGLVVKEPQIKAWVIRLPSEFVVYKGAKTQCSFQTVVMATTAQMAWETAFSSDVWEQLPWDIDKVQVFPKIPVTADGHHSPR